MPRRRHVAEHAKRLDEAQHEARIAKLAADRALRDLETVCREHGGAWIADLDERAAELEGAWDDALARLQRVHAERVSLNRRRRALGATVEPVGAVRFRPEQLVDSLTGSRLELAHLPDPGARTRQRAHVAVGDVVGALQTMREPDPAAPMPGASVAESLKRSLEHAETIHRGYSIDEAHGDSAPAVRQLPRTFVVDGATFHAPVNGDRGEE